MRAGPASVGATTRPQVKIVTTRGEGAHGRRRTDYEVAAAWCMQKDSSSSGSKAAYCSSTASYLCSVRCKTQRNKPSN